MTGPGRAPLRLHDAGAPLALLCVLGVVTASAAITRAAAAAAAQPGFDSPTLLAPLVRAGGRALAGGSLDPLIGPAGSRWLFWLVLALLGALLVAAGVAVGWWATSRWAQAGTPARSLARRRDYADMSGRGARSRAVALRPSLAHSSEPDPRDLGLRLGALGTLTPAQLYASEEDVLLMIAGPRSNKTSAVVVPAVLSAPGPVIVTSNKVDIYTLTVAPRGQLGRVFVLDPQAIAGTEQTWWWDPLAGIRDMADVAHLTGHFMQTISGERADPYFTRGAERLLGQLVLAAALASPQRSLRDVRQWLATRGLEPVQLLRAAGQNDVATALQGTIEAPPDQRGGLYETALTAIACLESEAVARYVTPPATWASPPRAGRVEEFDPWRFIVGYDRDDAGKPVARDTVYLLTREGAGTGAPVVAALVDHLLRTAAAAATASGGRVDPPIRAVLDEAANICPIRNLPDLYSYFGSMSIQVLTFLQSDKQGVAIWGKAGMDKLWSAATIKLIGAGVHDPAFCEDISRLLGEHDVPTWSDQRGRGGGSTTMSTRRDRILSAADVAALPKTSAVLIAAGRRPGLIRLQPWYAEPDADTISGPAAEAADQVRQAAIAHLGPTNPLAQLLAQRSDSGQGAR